MAPAKQAQLSLKVMMIKKSNKVLYAEIDRDFADLLMSFLTLPLGTVVRLLIKHYGNDAPILGSFNALYASLQNLDSRHFWTEAGKLMLLNPRNSSGTECSRLKVRIDDTPPIEYFQCMNGTCVSMYYNVKCLCSDSRNTMTGTDVEEYPSKSGGKTVFFENTSPLLLCDNLQIMINTPASMLRFFKQNDIQDTNVLEERTLSVGLKEIMELLKGSLVSKTPLTDMVLHISSAAPTSNKRKMFSAPDKFEPDDISKRQSSENSSSDSRKITLKVFVQKSTNIALFAQAQNDFIDFLFSLLTIPLGRIQSLLGNTTHLGCINNLYGSLFDLEILDLMKPGEAATRLVQPQISSYHLSCHQIFPLEQQSPPIIFKYPNCSPVKLYTLTWHLSGLDSQVKMIDPKGNDSFIKGPTTFIVNDNLIVSLPSSTSVLTNLNQLKISIHDVDERDLKIGMQEALSILKASLVSTCALSEGLKPFLMRHPKQEK